MSAASPSIAAPDPLDSRLERRIAARYRGRLDWRIVLEAVWSVGGWLAVVVLRLNDTLPLALGLVLNVLFAQACGTQL